MPPMTRHHTLNFALASAVALLTGCGGGDLGSGMAAASGRTTTVATSGTVSASTVTETAAAPELTSSEDSSNTSAAAAATTAETAAPQAAAETAAPETAAPEAVAAAPAPAVSSVKPSSEAVAASNERPVSTAAVASSDSNSSVNLSSSVGQGSDSYESIGAGPYRVVNNTWGVRTQPSGWNQQVGISSLQGDNSVDFRLKWSFPSYCGGSCEVISYPEVVYGRSASFSADAGAKLPRLVSDVSGLTTRYTNASVSTSGLGHLAYDLWTSNSPNALGRANRLAEIMLPEIPFAGYGVPNYPDAAGAGRAGQQAAGRNPNGYQGRETIGGTAYDVYFFPANSPYTGLAWKFIVFEPVVFGGTGGATRNWKPIIDFMVGKGWVSSSDYLNSVELGVEPVSTPGGTFGDVTVRGFKIDVN